METVSNLYVWCSIYCHFFFVLGSKILPDFFNHIKGEKDFMGSKINRQRASFLSRSVAASESFRYASDDIREVLQRFLNPFGPGRSSFAFEAVCASAYIEKRKRSLGIVRLLMEINRSKYMVLHEIT